MLDPRIYRASFLPVLLALLVVAFALQDRPRPIGSTLAPDAFGGRAAGALLDELAIDFPDRRPGSLDDEALARRVAGSLRRSLQPAGSAAPDPIVKITRVRGAQTIDGRRDLTNVVATRPGRPGAGIVIVAHRDAASRVAKAELSGTAAMLTLAQIIGRGRLRRTVTFVSTSGGSGGAAGARAAVADLPDNISAVLVLGDMASANTSRPLVIPYSSGNGVAPMQLRRTIESALRAEARVDPGGARAVVQWARQAFPLTVGEQGAFGEVGLPAVLLSASGERGPPGNAPISRARLEGFGRAALRSINALNNGPTIGGGPEPSLQIARKVLSGRSIRLLGGALLIPVLLVSIDGFARARRRREPVGRRLAWVGATVLPFLLTALAAVVLALVGLVDPAPEMAVPAGALPPDGAALAASIALFLVFVLGWLLVRPLVLKLSGVADGLGSDTAAPAIATLIVLCLLAVVVWVLNPFAAVLLAPALHLWMLAITPDWRWPRPVRLLAVLAGVVPFALVAVLDAGALGYSLKDGAWQAVLLVAGGDVGPVTWVLWSAIAGCATCAAIVALNPSQRPVDRGRPGAMPEQSGSIRGPGGYVGPGSLGAVGSGTRR
ncbi:hypothetical protein DSM112329_05319 [Paraconexibacter sp. AEG42_29]|uniref:Peptidase M28 domain-containing protein n=1 Tax=Paraconexibacter sp. AEG42_29 TaxID=2997339 RepID=A0AAU7B3G2_9ACTN